MPEGFACAVGANIDSETKKTMSADLFIGRCAVNSNEYSLKLVCIAEEKWQVPGCCT